MNQDGQGNPIAPDDRLYPVVYVEWGRDFLRGRRCWSIAVHWGLRHDAQAGEHMYRREVRLTFHFFVR